MIKPPVKKPSRISPTSRATLGSSTAVTVGVGTMLDGTVGVGRGVDVAGCSTATGVGVGPSVAVGGGSVPHYLSWSPSGDWLAFVTFNERAEDGRRPNLWIAHPDGQGEIRLGTAFESVWSPNGSRIAYNLYDEPQEAYLVWVYDTETGEQTQILPAGTAAVGWLVPSVTNANTTPGCNDPVTWSLILISAGDIPA